MHVYRSCPKWTTYPVDAKDGIDGHRAIKSDQKIVDGPYVVLSGEGIERMLGGLGCGG